MLSYRKKAIKIKYRYYVELGMKWIARFLGLSDTLAHKGNENSGRYPRGSGERPYQHTAKKGWSDLEIKDKETGEKFHLSEGERIRNPETFAGKGGKDPLREEVKEGLSERYNVDTPDDWSHAKGVGTVDYYGEDRDAEIHWFSHPEVGKCEGKIKKWLD